MDLWIRSQDKMNLEKANGIYLRNDFNFDDSKYDYDIWVNEYNFATYNSKERALEVLDEIQKFIENNCKKYKSNGDYYTSKYEDCVYQMPKE